MKILALIAPLLCSLSVVAQTAPAADPFQSLSFLEGTWDAKATGNPSVATSGAYTFRLELGNHIMARHSTTSEGCKGPATFDCEHGDLLYIFQEAPGQPLKAIYFDNEGHVIHYNVTTPDPTTAVFASDSSQPGPQFRLTYELKAANMSGKFQMRMPGQPDWKSYLEWSGTKHP